MTRSTATPAESDTVRRMAQKRDSSFPTGSSAPRRRRAAPLPSSPAQPGGRAGAARRHPRQQRGDGPRLRRSSSRSISTIRCTSRSSRRRPSSFTPASRRRRSRCARSSRTAEPISPNLTVPQYLGTLAANATTIINAEDYGRTVYDLATRRALIIIGEDMVNGAYDSTVDFTAADADRGSGDAALRSRRAAQVRPGLPGLRHRADQRHRHGERRLPARRAICRASSTGLTDLDDKLGGLQSSDSIILAGRPSMGKTALATNIAYNIAKAYTAERQPDGTDKAVDGAIVGFFSLEMSAEQLATRILSEQAEIALGEDPPRHDRRGRVPQARRGQPRDERKSRSTSTRPAASRSPSSPRARAS